MRWRQTRNDNEALLGPPSMLATLGLTDGGDGVSPAWVQQSLRSVSSRWPIFILVKLCLLVSIANIGPLLNASAYTLLLLAVTLLVFGVFPSLLTEKIKWSVEPIVEAANGATRTVAQK